MNLYMSIGSPTYTAAGLADVVYLYCIFSNCKRTTKVARRATCSVFLDGSVVAQPLYISRYSGLFLYLRAVFVYNHDQIVVFDNVSGFSLSSHVKSSQRCFCPLYNMTMVRFLFFYDTFVQKWLRQDRALLLLMSLLQFVRTEPSVLLPNLNLSYHMPLSTKCMKRSKESQNGIVLSDK